MMEVQSRPPELRHRGILKEAGRKACHAPDLRSDRFSDRSLVHAFPQPHRLNRLADLIGELMDAQSADFPGGLNAIAGQSALEIHYQSGSSFPTSGVAATGIASGLIPFRLIARLMAAIAAFACSAVANVVCRVSRSASQIRMQLSRAH